MSFSSSRIGLVVSGETSLPDRHPDIPALAVLMWLVYEVAAVMFYLKDKVWREWSISPR